MSVGQAFADIPIIDVTTGEDTTLAAVIGNGARHSPNSLALAHLLPERRRALRAELPIPRAGKKTVIDFYTSW